MAMQCYNFFLSSCILFFLFTPSIISAVQPPTPAIAAAPSPESNAARQDFIEKSCMVTRYQDLCNTSLSNFYTSNTNDLGLLTVTAINVSLTSAVHVADYVVAENKTFAGQPPSRAGQAVSDCTGLTKAAVRQIKRSLKQMVAVIQSRSDRGRVRFELSNVQTWMSAAITDADTCISGFEDGGGDGGGVVESDVSGRVKEVMKLISNALALVNSYVNAI